MVGGAMNINAQVRNSYKIIETEIEDTNLLLLGETIGVRRVCRKHK